MLLSLLDNQIGQKNIEGAVKTPITREKALMVIKDAFISAAERDTSTGDGIIINIITKNGIESEIFALRKDWKPGLPVHHCVFCRIFYFFFFRQNKKSISREKSNDTSNQCNRNRHFFPGPIYTFQFLLPMGFSADTLTEILVSCQMFVIISFKFNSYTVIDNLKREVRANNGKNIQAPWSMCLA